MNDASFVFFLVWASALAITLWGTLLALRHYRRPDPGRPLGMAPRPAISILKPVKGVDAGASENLESFFKLSYPEYELLFSVADPNDPVCDLIEYLIRMNPQVSARLIVGDVHVGPNPKINNMIRTYDLAEHDWILISDSNVRVPTDYLLRLSEQVDDNTGILTAAVLGSEPEHCGGHLEAVYLNTFYARAMILTQAAGHPCVVGKSMLFRRSAAERFGGIRTLARYLAEDYMAGQAMKRLGYEIRLMREPIRQHIGSYTFKDFWQRHIRWGRLRKAQAMPAFLLEPFSGCLVSGVIGSLAFESTFGVPPAFFFAAHAGVWLLADLLVMRQMGASLSVRMLGAWALREALCPAHWLHIAAGNTVQWRGRTLNLHPGGTVSEQAVATSRFRLALRRLSWATTRKLRFPSFGAPRRVLTR